MPRPLHRSESDLLVFVSSVMAPAFDPARETTTLAIQSLDFGHPWAFEYTPASSETAEDGYLRKVAEADFVIWLVGRETTQPVANEVTQCIASQGRLLVFRLPSEERTEETLRLLDTVSGVAKWQDVDDVSHLREAIRAALSDELVRSVRRPGYVSRGKTLRERHALSLSSCSAAWRSLGVPEDVASALAADAAVGNVLAYPPPGVHTVTGELGAGKTLAAERLYQTAILQALEDPSHPFPLFASAREVTTSLSNYIAQACQGYADPYVQGVLLIVDGLDERGTREANGLVQEALAYVDANPKATILFTSRSLAGLSSTASPRSMPELSDEELLSLLCRLSGLDLEPRHTYQWSTSMREAARNPLCAVIFGVRLRTQPDLLFSSRRRLIEEVIADARRELPDPSGDLDRLLHTLAALAVERGASVPLVELDSRLSQHNLLLRSRIVVETGGTVDFALPVFRDWYASRAVVEGTVPIGSFNRPVDRWLVPLAIALHAGSGTFVSDLLQHLAAADPGFTSMLIQEAVGDRWYLDDHEDEETVPSLRSPMAAGRAIGTALDAWEKGLGGLFRLVGPVTLGGTRRPLRVGVNGHWVTTHWYRGPAEREPSELVSPATADSQPLRDWTFSGRSVPNTDLWSWLLTKEDLGRELARALEGYELRLHSADAVRELSWELGATVLGSRTVATQELSSRDVIEGLEAYEGVEMLGLGGVSYSRAELTAVRDHWTAHLQQGREVVPPPWPERDGQFRSGPIWKTYSDGQLLSRTNAILSAALRIYREVVEEWFEPMAHHFGLYSLLPVKITGVLVFPEDRDEPHVHPAVMWQPRILPERADSSAEIEMGETVEEGWAGEDYFLEESEKYTALRGKPGQEAKLFSMSTSASHLLFQPRPATTLAFSWLEEEIEDLKWDR